jgi:endonuclease/exonuclease/phosphatase family metal-dependent hydrolase
VKPVVRVATVNILNDLSRWHERRTLRRDTLDYIFVSPGVQVLGCDLILNQPSPQDPTLYASDHFGLAATLRLSGRSVFPA